MIIPFSPPDITDLEVNEVIGALKSGWITTGPKVKELEKKIAKYVGVGEENNVPRCVCFNSQTAAAEMVLHLLGIGEGDEVIVPAYTYTASASIVCHVGAKLVLIDSQKDSLEMDYDAVEKAINERTKVIIPVSVGGVPCDYDRIFSIVEKKKGLFRPNGLIQEKLGRIVICEDTAHSLGAEYKGKKLGNVCDFSSFSFHAVKNFTTAEGGATTWKHIDGISDEYIYQQFQLYSLHGQDKDALCKNKIGKWEYDIIGTWYKCNMTDILGAIGLAQFERYPSLLARRKEIIEKYDKSLKPYGIQGLPHFTDKHSSSGHLYITRLFDKEGQPISDGKRREIIEKMADVGIACNVHYKPLPMHTAYIKMGFDIRNYPNALNYYLNEITLPLHTCLTDEEVDFIIENYIKIVKEYVGL